MRFGNRDLGGTKTEIVALAPGGAMVLRRRVETPKTYNGPLLRELMAELGGAERKPRLARSRGSVGMAIPGSESFGTNLIKNANTTYLIGKPLRQDLEAVLERPVRLANDANCFALSEASDGAAKGAGTVFGVIAGTGVGGGVVVDGKVLGGAHGIGGEWGHIPLPAPSVEEINAAPLCYCGKHGCLEVWCSGPGLAQDFQARATGRPLREGGGPSLDSGANCRVRSSGRCRSNRPADRPFRPRHGHHGEYPGPGCDCDGRRAFQY